jgi:GTP-binding protein EngB required for normal cell division
MSLLEYPTSPSVGIIERTAVGLSGRVGSLYDGCRDCVLEHLNLNSKQISPESDKPVSCELINGNTDKSRNLLQMIGIEADLRLNILLNPKLRTSVAAIIDHPHPLNEYTRFLHYTYVNRIEQLDLPTESTNLFESLNPNTTATHIITNVSWGISVVVVLQLSSDAETVTVIDEILGKVRNFLAGEQNDKEFSLQDEELLEKYINTKVYSNISGLRNITSLFALCQYINGRNEQFNLHRPLKYLLKPIKQFYPQYIGSGVNFSPFLSPSINIIEQHLIQLLDTVRKLKDSLDFTINDLLHGHLKERPSEVQQQLINLNTAYEQELERFQKLIIAIHSGCIGISQIDKALENHTQTTLSKCIETLTQTVNELKAKKQLITSLHEQHFEYCNVADLNVNKENYEQILLRNLMMNQRENRILCSNDTLNKKSQSKLNTLRDQLIKDYGLDGSLRLVYADFSYCTFELPDLMILPSSKKYENADIQKQYTSSSTEEDIINILLLGESGVGKSTFINAFVNYLTFNTLEQAESSKPVVLIPVSFLMTIDDNFEERIINFGDFNNFNNEDFDHPGQSVTQQCKSYLFALNRINGRKFRIIDTPGFADTRGLDQDDTNMQHILKYINNLTHLNAVCFLLKSNAIRLNSYFQTCLTQLLDFLSPNAHQNIIFCFTNARSTFYTPGDTAPLLKNMLKSYSMSDIPFKKENTFCFDNESFRYLVALKNRIHFNNDEEKQEYEKSWSISLKESNRLVSYISNQLSECPLHNQRQSIKHAQIEIIQMIRPMLETMRNILRHVVLHDMKILNKSIKLRPAAIHRPASRCNVCQGDLLQIGDFLIANHVPHEIYHQCLLCLCVSSQHSSIDYVIGYELLDRSPNYDRNQMNDMIRQLRQASNEFAYFLMNVVHSTKQDPFLIGLANMSFEENGLCRSQQSKHLNSKLVERLNDLQQTYEKNMDIIISNKIDSNLSTIYEWIQKVQTLPEVREQMAASKQSQRILMKEYEYIVPEELMK